jgi:glucose-6-phosphate isomerase
MTSLTATPAWKALEAHADSVSGLRMRDLFAADPGRFEAFSISLPGIFLDYAKNRVTADTMALLMDLARQAGVEDWRQRLFSGQPVNVSEGRPALHTALRNRSGGPVRVAGADVMPLIAESLARMREFSGALASGAWKGAAGKAAADVVCIGIGGSHLGPEMVCQALTPYHKPGPEIHFVANVDGADITQALAGLDPATTLFIVSSKSFTTPEVLANAATARAWITDAMGADAVASHFVAVTANPAAAAGFGIEAANTFVIWDWVGGRCSLWSAIGLPIAIAVGMDAFEDLLDGAHAMDNHFQEAPFESNMPVVMALLGVWYSGFLGAGSHAVLPYGHHLRGLPAYLQQLDMESNGKSVTRDGHPVAHQTGPVLFGAPGTPGQHSFFQLLHQGTRLVPADFIAAAESSAPETGHHAMLLANFFAQTEALMKGKDEEEARAEMEAAGVPADDFDSLLPHKVFAGNRPTNSILAGRFDPRTLGMLIALYEHKIFVQGVIWEINSFDQWGVELGKELAAAILPELEGGGPAGGHDSSTNGLINVYKDLKGRTP